ncbi:MAG: hypothetical protein EBU90_21220 [Proteobacteria bacterium]|nr:hypothetical protein [Pseudomonadota bacterium]NBP16066.1 hypothetical protein [bacterium]
MSEESSRLVKLNYKLFLDDIREPGDCFRMTGQSVFLDTDWVIVRDYNQFVDVVSERYLDYSFPNIVAFDHDLANEHYIDNFVDLDSYSKFVEKTGYHCAKWLIDFCIDKELPLPTYYCHSMNPAGKENILSILKSYKCLDCSCEGYHAPFCTKNV